VINIKDLRDSLTQGILVNLTLKEGVWGVIHVARLVSISKTSGVKYWVEAEMGWRGCQEPAEWSAKNRNVPPSDRSLLYMPFGFTRCEVIPTEGSRFLAKNVYDVPVEGYELHDPTSWNDTLICSDWLEFQAQLEPILRRIGVPEVNLAEVCRCILNKLPIEKSKTGSISSRILIDHRI
jgi:hypothetical protein